MPNRYIREGINSSRAVASLDAGAEVFYRRMLLVIDDFGRYEVDYLLIRSAAYPVHPDITETDIARWLAACHQAGLIAFYEVCGRRYIAFAKTEPPRARKSKYPDPPWELVEQLGVRSISSVAPTANKRGSVSNGVQVCDPQQYDQSECAWNHSEACGVMKTAAAHRAALRGNQPDAPPTVATPANICLQVETDAPSTNTNVEPVGKPAMSAHVNICSHVQTNVPYSNTITNTSADTNTNAPSLRAREDCPDSGAPVSDPARFSTAPNAPGASRMGAILYPALERGLQPLSLPTSFCLFFKDF
jgi:hypothetical protein